MSLSQGIFEWPDFRMEGRAEGVCNCSRMRILQRDLSTITSIRKGAEVRFFPERSEGSAGRRFIAPEALAQGVSPG
jgi:hypothetical protein